VGGKDVGNDTVNHIYELAHGFSGANYTVLPRVQTSRSAVSVNRYIFLRPKERRPLTLSFFLAKLHYRISTDV
jgi:hypothetical protein